VDSLAEHEVLAFLNRLGAMYPKPAALYLLGGGALCLLGSPRRTLDIDCTVNDLTEQTQDFVRTMETLATEMRLELEVIPIWEYDVNPADFRQYMNEVRRLFSQEGNDLSHSSAKR